MIFLKDLVSVGYAQNPEKLHLAKEYISIGGFSYALCNKVINIDKKVNSFDEDTICQMCVKSWRSKNLKV